MEPNRTRNEAGSIIAVADTHLGLKEDTTFKIFKNTMSCQPVILASFLRWVKELEEKDKFVTVEGPSNEIVKRRLTKPEKLIFLGDVLELWDASNKRVSTCLSSIIQVLSSLRCSKICLIGNHDYSNREIVGEYQLGNSIMEILPDTYPVQSRLSRQVIALRKGKENYIFTHGHLFDWTFRNLGRVAMIMSYIRDGAEAFGWFSWILFICLLTIPALMSILGFGTSAVYSTLLILGLLSSPRIITSIARPLWNKMHKPKYDRKRALKGFMNWWRRFSEGKITENGRLNVVYGHTHLLDLLHYTKALGIVPRSRALGILRKSFAKKDMLLINLPAWVRDSSEEGKQVCQNVFLYIDESGFEFFGWDDKKGEPYHIPEWAAERIGDRKAFQKKEIDSVRKLGFPDHQRLHSV
jgi:UDP-2,3-diacylglucosamine pyrophosphatase LpxH